MKRILVVANDFPYPPDHGAAVDIWARILVLREMGCGVDLLASVREVPDEDHMRTVREHVGNLWIAPRRRGLPAALSLLPFQARSRLNLKDIVLGQRYDAVLLEAEHVAAFLKNPSARQAKLILRIHNNEVRYFRELAKGAGSWWKKVFYSLESCKFRFFSPAVRRSCDFLWFISDFERQEFIQNNPQDERRSIFLPPDVRRSTLRPFSTSGRTALFIGTLTIPHNADAVAWYISEVHPLLSGLDDYALMVAGRTAGHPITDLKRRIQRHRNIFLSENPRTLDSLYQSAAVFVNPVRRGAGLKLKIIQALEAGLPAVSTSVGIEGTGLEDAKHLLVADTAPEFAYCVQRLLTERTLAESLVRNAQAFLAERYDMKANLQRILPRLLYPGT